MKKFLSRMTFAVVVALVMSLGVALPALAAEAGTPATSTPAAEFGITKQIQTPANTTIPDADFHFTFTQLMPSPDGTGYVVRPSGHTGAPSAASIPNASTSFTYNGANADVAGDIFDGANFPHAGDFVFRVTELRGADSTNNFEDNEHMTYSNQVFVIIVRVINAPTDADPLRVEPSIVVAVEPEVRAQEAPATGNVYTWVDADKVDDIRFINVFTRDIVPDPTDPTSGPLTISKTIGEIQESSVNLLTDFTFEATITVPQAALDRDIPFEGPVTATIIDTLDGNAVVRPVPFTGTLPVLTADFELRHGQVLVFPTLPAGTSFQVTERQEDNFSGTAAITIAGDSTAGSYTSPVGVDIATRTYSISDALAADDSLLGNSADFTNIYHESPLTGLMLTSMPFVIALVVAALILAMMVASRSRRRIEEMPIAY